MIPLPVIDADELIRTLPRLSAVRFRLHSWDGVGDRLARELLDAGAGRRSGSRAWILTRMELFRLFATCDPVHAEMRAELETHPPESTGDLIARLVPWLSGVLGIPPEAALPLVCVGLFRISSHSVHALLPTETERVG